MTALEATNRGNNLASIIIVALSGFAFLPEVFLETEISFKIDDILLFALGLTAIVWYRWKNNRYTRSFVPVLFVLTSLVVKVGAIFLEIKDKEDAGDDFGALILFVLASVFVIWLYKKSAKN